MPEYTYSPAPVLVETTGEFAIGATGVLRPLDGGDPVPVFDLNDSPLLSVQVGPRGAHQAFKADIPNGVLDFGSTQIVAVSVEAITAALTAIGIANDAMNAALTSVGRVVFAGDDPSTPRPNVEGPVLWLCSGDPVNADDDLDYWFRLDGIPVVDGGVEVTPDPTDSDAFTGSATPDPNDPDAFIFAGTPDPNDPDAYVF